MKRADQVAGGLLLLLSLAALSESGKLAMVYGSSPGPGFLPFWLTLGMAVLSAFVFVGALRRPAASDVRISWPSGRGRLWIAATLVALLAYTFSITIIGYILSTFLFMWLLVGMLGSYRWYQSAGIGLATALTLYLIFQVWLVMGLPTGRLIIP